MEDASRSLRLHVLKAGLITFGGGTVDCAVRNISRAGATLEVASQLYIPNRFTLVVQADQLRRPCRIVWRNERRIGVVFD